MPRGKRSNLSPGKKGNDAAYKTRSMLALEPCTTKGCPGRAELFLFRPVRGFYCRSCERKLGNMNQVRAGGAV